MNQLLVNMPILNNKKKRHFAKIIITNTDTVCEIIKITNLENKCVFFFCLFNSFYSDFNALENFEQKQG